MFQGTRFHRYLKAKEKIYVCLTWLIVGNLSLSIMTILITFAFLPTGLEQSKFGGLGRPKAYVYWPKCIDFYCYAKILFEITVFMQFVKLAKSPETIFALWACENIYNPSVSLRWGKSQKVSMCRTYLCTVSRKDLKTTNAEQSHLLSELHYFLRIKWDCQQSFP